MDNDIEWYSLDKCRRMGTSQGFLLDLLTIIQIILACTPTPNLIKKCY